MATQEKTWNVANRMHSQKDSDNPEVNHIIAGADEIYDDEKGAKQSEINAQTDAALADRYTKEETYSKEQLDALITTPDANYVTVATFADLPQTGEGNTVYRVSSYDGTQVDASKYALYAWNGTSYQMLAVRSAVGEVFDVSEYNSGATYETLTAALAAVPASVQRGGMSIKFILRTNTGTEEEPVYHDEYVQYRLMSTDWSTVITDWQGVDKVPTPDSDNLVRSGGVQNELALGAVYDVSAKNPTAGPNNDGKFESLSALLSDNNLNILIPTAVRKGGMSIKFVHSSDNKYVQYRLMADSWSTVVTDWQGMDDEPTPGSENLVKSGGVAKELGIISLEQGSINSSGFTDTANNRIRSNDFCAEYINITATNNANVRVYIYNIDGTFVKDDGIWRTSVRLFNKNLKYKFVFRFNDNRNIVPSDIIPYIEIQSLTQDITEFKSNISDFDDNKITKSLGVNIHNSANAYTGTDFPNYGEDWYAHIIDNYGQIITSANYNISNFIEINYSKQYKSNVDIKRIVVFDESKCLVLTYVENYTANSIIDFSSFVNAKYVIIQYSINFAPSDVKFGLYADNINVDFLAEDLDMLGRKLALASELQELDNDVSHINTLINGAQKRVEDSITVEEGTLSISTGEPYNDSRRLRSDFIVCDEIKVKCTNGNIRILSYKANGDYIGETGLWSKEQTASNGKKYRFIMAADDVQQDITLSYYDTMDVEVTAVYYKTNNFVATSVQNLTDQQKRQARINIGLSETEKKITAIGSSGLDELSGGQYQLTEEQKQMYGVTSDLTMTRVLQILLDYDKTNILAYGGNPTSCIYFKNGLSSFVLLNSFTLPADKSAVSYAWNLSTISAPMTENLNVLNPNAIYTFDGIINGINVRVDAVNGTIKLLDDSDIDITIPAGSVITRKPITSNLSNNGFVRETLKNTTGLILQIGANSEGCTPSEIIDYCELAIKESNCKWFVVLPANKEGKNVTTGDNLEAVSYFKKKYGSRYIDHRVYMCSLQALIDQGITPTTSADYPGINGQNSNPLTATQIANGVECDMQCIAEGYYPSSFWHSAYRDGEQQTINRSHFNAQGLECWGKYMAKMIKQFLTI